MFTRPALRPLRALTGLAALMAVSACEMLPEPALPETEQQVEPASVFIPDPVRPTSTKSAELRGYLGAVQSSQLTQGLLRRDGGGPDTPFTSDMLARNFIRIAFFNEYGGPNLRRGGQTRLRRWVDPVQMSVVFGSSVPRSQRDRDTRDVESYARRLTRATGHPVTVGPNPNFLVFFVSEDDRATTIDRIAPMLPGVTQTNLAPVRNLSDDTYCAVAAYAGGDDPYVYTAAVAVIRAENPDLLRLSCIHEELAQGLGLANDSPEARPSIFNDDDEFALLTTHDEALLAMLYDDRLSPGMALEQARPIVRDLASGIVDGAGPS
ncbi:MAG: DUF2927 domain-containing protein [Pseudomonadota bacterium]